MENCLYNIFDYACILEKQSLEERACHLKTTICRKFDKLNFYAFQEMARSDFNAKK